MAIAHTACMNACTHSGVAYFQMELCALRAQTEYGDYGHAHHSDYGYGYYLHTLPYCYYVKRYSKCSKVIFVMVVIV